MSHTHVAVIGAGFGGIGASIKLAEAGELDHVIFEQQHDVGGTWSANRYPGCRCDINSNLYSFSFAPNPEWTNTYSYQEEIQRYLRGVAEDRGVIPRIRFGVEVRAARWDAAANHWAVDTTDGPWTADVLVAANGFLSEPSIPRFEGMERFTGEVMHSARWDPSHDVAGKRVAVVGTGASAVQLIPRVHRDASHVVVFQRTAGWVLPHRGKPVKERTKALYRRVPAAQRLARSGVYYSNELLLLPSLLRSVRLGALRKLALDHLEAQVPDPQLRARLTPTFEPGCKRLMPTDEYLPAIASPTTTLVTSGIERIDETGIVTRDGEHHDVDVIILATGFRVTDNRFSARLTGLDGRTLREVWDAGSMGAYNGTVVAGFPNLFMLAGPNTGIGHTSLVYMIEAQLPYVVGALRHMRDNGVVALDVRPEVQAAYNEELQRKFARTVWTTGGCRSWYLDARGNNPTLWPDYTWRFARRLRHFDIESYYQVQRPVAPAAALASA